MAWYFRKMACMGGRKIDIWAGNLDQRREAGSQAYMGRMDGSKEFMWICLHLGHSCCFSRFSIRVQLLLSLLGGIIRLQQWQSGQSLGTGTEFSYAWMGR